MTPIEELVRQALAETPTATTATDPLAALDRRVRRARRWLAAGAGAATAAVVAAVVVPLAVLGGNNAGKVDVVNTPTPSPSRTATAIAGADVWLSGAHGVTSGGGFIWTVAADSNDSRSLLQIDPSTGEEASGTTLDSPADFALYAGGEVWVWGGGDGAYPDSLLQVRAISKGRLEPGGWRPLSLPQTPIFDVAVVDDNAWVVVPDAVVQVQLVDHVLKVVSQTPLTGAHRIVATPNGHLWVQADSRFIELVPTGGSGPETGPTEHWAGPLLAASTGDSVWSTDDPRRAVELDPTALGAGASVALVGKRLMTAGRPTLLTVDADGGVYVAFHSGRAPNGEIDYFAPGNSFGPASARLPDADVETMAAAPGGGLAISTFSGQLQHWDPAAAAR